MSRKKNKLKDKDIEQESKSLIKSDTPLFSIPNSYGVPLGTLGFMGLLYLASYFNRGVMTWAFNPIIYMPAGDSIMTLAGLFLMVILITVFRHKLENWNPSSLVQQIVLSCLFLISAWVIIQVNPLFPHLEGDAFPSAGRFGSVAGTYISHLLGIPFLLGVQIIWKLAGLGYLGFGMYFCIKIFPGFWDRVNGYLLMASQPVVLNYIGYYDSYGDFFLFGSLFLGLVYLYSHNRKWPYLLGALICLALAGWSHNRFYSLIIYPLAGLYFLGMGKLRGNRDSRGYSSLLLIFGIILAGLVSAYQFSFQCPHHPYQHMIGYMFEQIAKYDGIISPFYHPFLLVASFLLSYIFLMGLILVTSRSSFTKETQWRSAAALYGSLGFFLAYYLMQVLMPMATYEVLDFVCQSGCLGVLIVIPMMVVLAETGWKRWIYCLVALNLFITIPSLVIHSQGGVEKRLIASLEKERSISAWELSPFVPVGLHFKEDDARDLCVETFSLGANQNETPFKLFRFDNRVYLIAWLYEWGEYAEGRQQMEVLLRENPDMGARLLNPNAGFPNRKHFIPRTLHRVKDLMEISEKLYKETGKPIYLTLARYGASYLLKESSNPF